MITNLDLRSVVATFTSWVNSYSIKDSGKEYHHMTALLKLVEDK